MSLSGEARQRGRSGTYGKGGTAAQVGNLEYESYKRPAGDQRTDAECEPQVEGLGRRWEVARVGVKEDEKAMDRRSW